MSEKIQELIKARLLEIEECLKMPEYELFYDKLSTEKMLLLKAMYGVWQAEKIRLNINLTLNQ